MSSLYRTHVIAPCPQKYHLSTLSECICILVGFNSPLHHRHHGEYTFYMFGCLSRLQSAGIGNAYAQKVCADFVRNLKNLCSGQSRNKNPSTYTPDRIMYFHPERPKSTAAIFRSHVVQNYIKLNYPSFCP